MWSRLTLLLILGASVAVGKHDNAWDQNNEYQYLIESRTLTSLNKLDHQYSGFLLKGLLTIHVVSPDLLRAVVTKPEFANVHTKLSQGKDTEIPEDTLDYQNLDMSEKPFEIRLKHGVIRDMLVDKSMPIWEINLLKSLISQLQLDTQGENLILQDSTQVPTNLEKPYAMFLTMEDSVSGKCEVAYDIAPLSEEAVEDLKLVPLPDLSSEHIDLIKTKNYKQCMQLPHYQFGLNSKSSENLLTRTSNSRVVLSGNLKKFTIQSSVTKNDVFVSPKLDGNFLGNVYSKMSLLLASKTKQTELIPELQDPVSTGNLVYIYNNPFSDNERFEIRQPSISKNSMQAQSSESIDVSSEERQKSLISLLSNDRISSSSSSNTNSRNINSEQRSILQSRPKMDQPPENPFLPNFIGFNGKNIQKSKNIDLVVDAKQLLEDIVTELETTSDVMLEGTLEKYTTLIGLIRLMNLKQINELLKEHSASASAENSQQTLEVIHNAVAQSGTGPALLVVSKLIREKKLQKFEAAQAVSMLSKTVITPTQEYVQTFFELIKEPIVQNQQYLNSVALYAFADLLYNTQVNRKVMQERYPIYAFGLMSEDDKEVTNTYIPYMAKELEKAVRDNNSSRIQALIISLGRVSHPKILSVFEPYLEGRIPLTKHQRLEIVSVLGLFFSKNNPELVRSVLYKIYTNVEEDYEVRCSAVFSLIQTNPPATMLQRIAQYTNVDKNKQVNSIVKTLIESIAEMNVPQRQELSSKARIAKKLLSPKADNYRYSKGYVTQANLLSLLKNLKTSTTEIIGSTDSEWPKGLYFLTPIEDVAGLPKIQFTYLLSSMKQFIEKLQGENVQEQSHIKQIARLLKMQPQKQEELEGMIAFDNECNSQLYTFGENDIDELLKVMKLSSKMQLNHNFLHSPNLLVSFPTETGLPFTYVLKAPTVAKLNLKKNEGLWKSGSDIEISGDAMLEFATKKMSRFGFITPFHHNHYLSGIDTDLQLGYTLSQYKLKSNANEQSLKLRVRPNLKDSNSQANHKLLHYKVFPFTTRKNILNFQPLLSDKNTHVVKAPIEQEKVTLKFGDLNLTVRKDKQPQSSNTLTQLLNLLTIENAHITELEVVLKSDTTKDLAVLDLVYDKQEKDTQNQEEKSQLVHTADLSNIFKAHMTPQERKNRMLEEVIKGISSPIARVIDLTVDLPIAETKYIATVGLASSNADIVPNYQTLTYLQSLKNDGNVNFEVCASGHLNSTRHTPLDVERTIRNSPRQQFHSKLQFGANCQNGHTIEVKSTQTRNEELEAAIVNSDIVKKCKQEMQNGNKALQACQKANMLAELKNQMSMSVEVSDKSLEAIVNVILSKIGIKNQLVKNNVLIQWSQEVEANKSRKRNINLDVKMSADLKVAEVSLKNSQINIKSLLFDLSKINLIKKLADRIWQQEDIEGLCTIDKSQAITFDNKVYPLRLGKCQHVMMTASLQQDNNNPSQQAHVPQNLEVAVIVQEENDMGKHIQLVLGDTKIDLQKSNGQIEVVVDEQKIMKSLKGDAQIKKNNEIIANIIELADNSVLIASDKYQISLLFDGELVQVQVSDAWRNAIRGLCGNFDRQSDNDFITPQNCILKNPAEFTAMYALTEKNCQGPAIKNKQIAERAQCIQQTQHLNNVVSDKEAGRPWIEDKQWGQHQRDTVDGQRKQCTKYSTKIIEDNNNICFTTRPLPECQSNCQSVETKTKQVSLHCLPRNDVSINMKRRIEQGANPNMSQRSVSKKQAIEIPIACIAA